MALGQRWLGTQSLRHGITRGLGLLVGIGELQLAPGLAHVPVDLVGQHAQEDVCTYAIGRATMEKGSWPLNPVKRPRNFGLDQSWLILWDSFPEPLLDPQIRSLASMGRSLKVGNRASFGFIEDGNAQSWMGCVDHPIRVGEQFLI